MQYTTILFDVDGTVVESGDAIATSLQKALAFYGVKREKESLKKYIGPSIRLSAGEFFDDEETIEKFIRKYRADFPAYIPMNKTYVGIPALLDDLKAAGFQIGIATAKPEASCMMTLDYLGISDKFDYISYYTPGDSLEHKKDIIERAICKLYCNREEAVMVGDTRFDLMGAEMCGIDAVGVLYGYGDLAQMKEYPSVCLCDTVADVRRFFLETK